MLYKQLKQIKDFHYHTSVFQFSTNVFYITILQLTFKTVHFISIFLSCTSFLLFFNTNKHKVKSVITSTFSLCIFSYFCIKHNKCQIIGAQIFTRQSLVQSSTCVFCPFLAALTYITINSWWLIISKYFSVIKVIHSKFLWVFWKLFWIVSLKICSKHL